MKILGREINEEEISCIVSQYWNKEGDAHLDLWLQGGKIERFDAENEEQAKELKNIFIQLLSHDE